MKTTDEKIQELLRLEQRRQEMIKKRSEGVSLAAIGREYGISKARVAQVLKATCNVNS